jgi:hypothetical protein
MIQHGAKVTLVTLYLYLPRYFYGKSNYEYYSYCDNHGCDCALRYWDWMVGLEDE